MKTQKKNRKEERKQERKPEAVCPACGLPKVQYAEDENREGCCACETEGESHENASA